MPRHGGHFLNFLKRSFRLVSPKRFTDRLIHAKINEALDALEDKITAGIGRYYRNLAVNLGVILLLLMLSVGFNRFNRQEWLLIPIGLILIYCTGVFIWRRISDLRFLYRNREPIGTFLGYWKDTRRIKGLKVRWRQFTYRIYEEYYKQKTSFLIRGAHRALGKIGIVQDRETLFKTIYRRITDFAIDLFRERLIRLLLLTGLCILIGFVVKNVVVQDMVHRGLFPVMVYPLTFLIREIQSLFN